VYCKIFCHYDDKDLLEINKIFSDYKSFRIITDNESSNNLFKKNGYNSKTLEEIFPNYSELTYEIYQNTKNTLLKYESGCKAIKFKELDILNAILRYLKNDVLLLEQTRKILEKKENVVLVFKKYSPTYFAILKLASEMGYNTNTKNLTVLLVKGKKAKKILPNESQIILEGADKISKYKKYFSIFLKNLSENQSKNKLSSLVKIAKKTTPLALQLLTSKFYEMSPSEAEVTILKRTDKKILDSRSTEYAFFLSSDREDVLKVYYLLFDKFAEKKIKVKIFTIDPITSSFLDKKGLPYTDLFEETYILANILKRTKEGNQLNEQIIQESKRNNLDLLYLEKLNSVIIEGIYRSLATNIIFEHIINQLNLKKVVIIDTTMFGKVIASIANKFKIPTLSVVSLIVDDNAILSLSYNADKICIYGQQGYDVLIAHGFKNDRIAITGNPRYDFIKSSNQVKARKVLENSYHISSKNKLIVIAMSRWHENDENWISKFIKFCNKNDFEIVIKIHPRYKRGFEESENKIQFIKKECQNEKFHLTYDVDLNLLLSGSDVVISDYSNVGVEAILLNKPVVNVNFIKEGIGKAQNYHEYGAVLYVEEYDKLENLITGILLKNEYIEELEKGRQKIIDLYNFNNDGNATQRIFDLLTQSA